MSNTEALRQRLSDEADLCRNDGATDIAALLDEAAAALAQPAADIDEAHIARLHERGAVAWAGVDAADLRAGGDGMPAASGEPLFWYRPCRDGLYEGPHHHNSVGGRMLRDEKPGEWVPLYATAQPAPALVPLTEAQIDELFDADPPGASRSAQRRIARAIEAAHGITPAKEAP